MGQHHHGQQGGEAGRPRVLLPLSLLHGRHPPPPQAGTYSGCQPEGLKFLQLAQPLLKLRKQKGEGAAVNCKQHLPRLAAPQLLSTLPPQHSSHAT